MRFGISWDPSEGGDASKDWKAMVNEAIAADGLGLDSVWVHQEDQGDAAVTAPVAVLAYLSSKTSSVQLRLGQRRVGRSSPIRIAEELAVLDTFSAGRSGLSFAGSAHQSVPPEHLREVVELTLAAWRLQDFRYRGEHVRFPAHTPDDVLTGVSTPSADEPWAPQWEWGGATPDYLVVTPKPVQVRPPLSVELGEDTAEWAAALGVSPFVGPDVPTEQAVELLADYQARVQAAGAAAWCQEPVLERRMDINGSGDDRILGGEVRELADQIRRIGRRTGLSHVVWRRTQSQRGRSDQLFTAASELTPLLQA